MHNIPAYIPLVNKTNDDQLRQLQIQNIRQAADIKFLDNQVWQVQEKYKNLTADYLNL